MKLTVEHTDHRGHAIEIAPRRRARRRRRADRARRRRHGERGGQRHARRVRPAAQPDCARRSGWCPAARRTCSPARWASAPTRSRPPTSSSTCSTSYRRRKSWRRIGLMDCGERWAVFTAGMGVDGEVVAAVEAQRDKGRKVTASRYIRVAVTRDAGQRPQGTDADAAPARPRAGFRRALRVRVELQPVDLRQRPAGVDESRPPPSRRAWACSRPPA